MKTMAKKQECSIHQEPETFPLPEFHLKKRKRKTIAKKQECSIHQEPETIPVPKVEAPQTKAYLGEKLNSLEKQIDEARWHSEDLGDKIRQLQGQKAGYDSTVKQLEEEQDKLMPLYKELGGNEWEITG